MQDIGGKDSSVGHGSYLSNKVHCTFKPLVVTIGIEKYNEFENKKYILNDYINVDKMLNNL